MSPFWGILAPHKSTKALKVGLVVMGFTCKLIPLCQEPSMCESFLMSLTSHAGKFFFIPLANVASLPAQAVEHPNAILEPNLDSNTHPSPQPAPNPTPNPTHDPNPNPNQD